VGKLTAPTPAKSWAESCRNAFERAKPDVFASQFPVTVTEPPAATVDGSTLSDAAPAGPAERGATAPPIATIPMASRIRRANVGMVARVAPELVRRYVRRGVVHQERDIHDDRSAGSRRIRGGRPRARST